MILEVVFGVLHNLKTKLALDDVAKLKDLECHCEASATSRGCCEASRYTGRPTESSEVVTVLAYE